MKPRLPAALEARFPSELLHIIYSFIPPQSSPKPKVPSPQLQKELTKIQSGKLKGINAMFMYDLEEFLLDK